MGYRFKRGIFKRGGIEGAERDPVKGLEGTILRLVAVSDDSIASRSDTNVGDGYVELLLDEEDVVLSSLRELFERTDVFNVFSPSLQSGVGDLNLGEGLQRGGESSEGLSIKRVVSGNLEGLDAGENVELSQSNVSEAVNVVRVTQLGQVEPSTTTSTTSSSTVFVSNVEQVLANAVSVVQFGGERSGANTSRVSLHDTNNGTDTRRSDTKASDGASNGRIG